ncbi:MAG: hypothetical protein AAGC43_00030 [Bacteroidota bacterium]
MVSSSWAVATKNDYGITFKPTISEDRRALQVKLLNKESYSKLYGLSDLELSKSLSSQFNTKLSIDKKEQSLTPERKGYKLVSTSQISVSFCLGIVKENRVLVMLMEKRGDYTDKDSYNIVKEIFSSLSSKNISSKSVSYRTVNSNKDNRSSVKGRSLVGKWIIAEKNVDMTSGPFGVLVAGSASKWKIGASVGNANAWGSEMIYNFREDGKYSAKYKALATMNLFQSYMDVTEQGSFSIQGDQLILAPIKYEGEGYFGHASQKKPMSVTGLKKRTYLWKSNGTQLLLLGPCGDFQVEPHCGPGKRFLTGFNKL